MNDRVKVPERLYLTARGDQVVPAGHPKAATLFAPEGREVSQAELERLGYGGAKGGKPKGDKASKPAENKGAQ